MLGKRLKQIREKLGLSQSQLANILKVNQKTISHWENERNEPSMEVLRTLCSEFNVNLNWLLTGEGPMFLNEIPQIPGIEDDEREILRILREYPELKPKILKLLKGIRTVDEAMEEIKTQTSMSLETPLTTQK